MRNILSFAVGGLLVLAVSTADASPVSTNGLISWWKLDDGTGATATDSWGSNGSHYNNGTLNGNPTWTTDTAGPYSLSALHLNGAGDYVNCGSDASLNITDGISIEAWVKSPDASHAGIVGKMSVAEWWTKGYYLKFNGNGGFEFVLNGVMSNTASAYDDNTWHHVVAAWAKGGSLNLYVDGNEVTYGQHQSSSATVPASSDVFKIGFVHAAQYLNGTIDEVRLYNRALSLAEIRQNFGALVPEPSGFVLLLAGGWLVLVAPCRWRKTRGRVDLPATP